jgi:transposase
MEGIAFHSDAGGTEVYADMEQWNAIRRRVLVDGLSQREACKQYDLHWRTLKKILTHEEPPGYRRVKSPRRPTIEPVLPVIRQILDDDTKAPRKQRPTAKRIWQRLRDEHGFTGGYTSVKDAVRELKVGRKEVFQPLTHPPGEAQVDFGFAEVVLTGGADLGGRIRDESAVFGCGIHPGVPAGVHGDVPGVARPGIHVLGRGTKADRLRQHEDGGGEDRRAAGAGTDPRVLTAEELLPVRQSFLPGPPTEREGHVEKLVDYARSNFLVPVPTVRSLDELNAQLVERCRKDQERSVRGKSGTVVTLLAEDRSAMLPLSARPFDARRVEDGSADSLSLVRFDTNAYAVPTKYAHRPVKVVASVSEVRIIYEDRLVAQHPRCWGREQYLFDPIHYLALLERKPGGFDFARPLAKWELPECYGVLRRRLEAEDPTGHGTRAFIRVLRLLETHTPAQLTDAVEYALDLGIEDPDSVRMILEYRADRPTELFRLDGRPQLAGVRVPPTDLAAYGELLAPVADVGMGVAS